MARPGSVEPRKRKSPTLIQNRVGQWYARFRREGVDVPLGIQTQKRRKAELPPEDSQFDWITVGAYHYPKHVYDKFQADLELPYLRGEFSPSRTQDGISVQDAAERFIKRKGLTTSTRESYRSTFRSFVDSLVDRRMLLREIRPQDIESFVERDQLSIASQASYARQINALINWAAKEGLLEDASVTVKVASSSSGRLGRKLFLTPRDYIRIRESIERAESRLPEYRRTRRYLSWATDVYDLAIATGLRLDELVHLQWQDVQLNRGILEVRPKSDSDDGFDFMPKGKRARFIELHPLAVEVLSRSHIASRKDDGKARVLTGPDVANGSGDTIDPQRASRLWRKHRKMVNGIDPVPLHGLRHMYVTYQLIVGYPTYFVQAWAGHASITTTENYAQFTRQLCSRRERERLIDEIAALGFNRP